MPVAVLRRGDTGAEISLDGARLGWVIGQGCEDLAGGMLSAAARSRFVVNKGPLAFLSGRAGRTGFTGVTNRDAAAALERRRLGTRPAVGMKFS
jgi:hypothetical protein